MANFFIRFEDFKILTIRAIRKISCKSGSDNVCQLKNGKSFGFTVLCKNLQIF